MAETIKLNTRIISKNVTLEQAKTGTWTPYEGEIVLAKVETQQPDGHGGVKLVPTFLMKVGAKDSSGNLIPIKDLKWTHAPASDVYAWAKQSTLPVEFAATYTTEHNAITNVEFKTTTSHPDGAIVITKDKFVTAGDYTEQITQLANAISEEAKSRGQADTDLANRIKPIEDWKKDTNFVTEVKSGDGITVTDGATATPTVAIKLDGSAATGNNTKVALSTSANGLKAEVDLSAYALTETVNAALSNKSDKGHEHTTSDLTDWATVKESIDKDIDDAQANAEDTAAKALDDYKKSVETKIGYIDTGKNISTAISDAVAGEAGLRAAADSALDRRVTTLEGEVDVLQEKITGVTGAMHFIGISSTDPSTGTVTIGEEVINNAAKGDVVVYKVTGENARDAEFVYDGASWVELGDVSKEAARISTLETKVDVAKVSKAISDAVDAEAALRDAADSNIKNNIIGALPTGDDGYATVVAGIAAAKKAGTDAQSALDTFVGETAPATYATLTAFNTYTGTTAPEQFASKSGFETFRDTTVPTTYATKEELTTGLDKKAPTQHNHAISDVTGLQDALDGKSNNGHKHTKSDITDFAHTHTVSEITDYATDVANKITAYGYETVENVDKIRTTLTTKVAQLDTDGGKDVLKINGQTIIFDCGGVELA